MRTLPPPLLGVERALATVRTLPPPLLGVLSALEEVRTLPPPLLVVLNALEDVRTLPPPVAECSLERTLPPVLFVVVVMLLLPEDLLLLRLSVLPVFVLPKESDFSYTCSALPRPNRGKMNLEGSACTTTTRSPRTPPAARIVCAVACGFFGLGCKKRLIIV